MSDADAAPALLVVVAHPDDESLACGATVARAAAAGMRTAVLTLTRGEAGADGHSSALAPLAVRRAGEFLAATRVLDVSCAMLRSHPDGMLPWVDPEALVHDITQAIRFTAASVVITFGEDGLYWHPDHIAVFERTVEAVSRLGAGAPALYGVTMPPGQMRAIAAADASRRPVVPGLFDADAFGASAAAPTLVVPCGRFARTKLAAIRCHRSQFAASAFAAIPDDGAEDLLDVEHFHRVAAGAGGPTVLDALAASPPSPGAPRR